MNARVKLIMLTGDQSETARAMASTLQFFDENKDEVIQSSEIKTYDDLSNEDRQRLIKATVFARVSPKQKLDLIDIHQKNGSVVAMTGDGVNDAPALKKADIGVAMGKKGTQVAQQAADMILKDDAFSTIVSAIFQGRVIFENIRKFISYLLSCNAGSLLSVAFASFLNLPLPVLPLQILFLNLVTDISPAIALGLGEADPEIMNRKPRNKKEPILAKSHWISIGIFGFLISFCVIGALVIAREGMNIPASQAVTISFLTLGFSRIWNVFNMRERGANLFKNEVTLNSYIYGAIAICIGLLLAAVYIPGLADVLQLVKLNAKEWSLIIGISLFPLVLGQIVSSIKWKKIF